MKQVLQNTVEMERRDEMPKNEIGDATACLSAKSMNIFVRFSYHGLNVRVG